MPQANDLRKGQAIRYNGDIAVVLEVMHRTPGNLRAFVQAIIRSIKTGKSADVTLRPELIGDAKDYLTENLAVTVLYAEGRPVEVELPSSVNLKVIESAEGVRGDSANNVQKPATLETGKVVHVPLFIKEGETIKIDTRNGAYMGRS